MYIQVLGTGCKKCKELFTQTESLVKELGIDATVEYVNDIEKVAALGVMSVPVLAIDGKPVSVGVVPDKEALTKLLSEPESAVTHSDEKKPGCACNAESLDIVDAEKKTCCSKMQSEDNQAPCACRK